MNLHVLVAATALALCLAALATLALSDPQVEEPGAPTYAGPPVVFLAAARPEIGDFDSEFHVNTENPFVPTHERGIERRAQGKQPVRPVVVRAKPLPPPTPGARIEVPKPPEWPKGTPRPEPRTPTCVGLIAHESGRKALSVRMDPAVGSPTETLEVGGIIEGWQLLDLANGVARFRTPDGDEQLLLISAGAATAANPTLVPEAPTGPAPIDPADDPGQAPAPSASSPGGTRPPQSPAPLPRGPLPDARTTPPRTK